MMENSAKPTLVASLRSSRQRVWATIIKIMKHTEISGPDSASSGSPQNEVAVTTELYVRYNGWCVVTTN